MISLEDQHRDYIRWAVEVPRKHLLRMFRSIGISARSLKTQEDLAEEMWKVTMPMRLCERKEALAQASPKGTPGDACVEGSR